MRLKKKYYLLTYLPVLF